MQPSTVEPTPARPASPTPRWPPTVAGLVVAAVALGTGELVAGFVPGAGSPVAAVGGVVIDGVPAWARDLAIDLFGTSDKGVLVVGIVVLAGLFGAGLGRLATRRLRWAALGVVGFGLVGIVAALTRSGATVGRALPSAAAAVAGVATLRLLVTEVAGGRRRPAGFAALDRRAFLRASAVLTGSAVVAASVGRALQSRLGAVASRAGVVLPRAAAPLPPLADGVDLAIDGLSPFVTPNGDFYRIDTALFIPQVIAEDWELRIHGMVERELRLSYADLLARPLVEADVTLSCVSNEVGGDLVGNARWQGVRLAELLAEAGVQDGATQVVGRSVDGFTNGFPTELALDGRDALVAVGMNGEPLPIQHGFPVRLVVPGLYGYVSATKWLAEIELSTLDGFDGYWIRRGWSKDAPVKTQSRIDVPRAGSRMSPGRQPVAGVAWAPTRAIDRVEVQVDDGPWADARLAEVPGDTTWRQWVHQWDATPGPHRIRSRATDGDGATQPEERVPPIPDGATGWHTVEVFVEDA